MTRREQYLEALRAFAEQRPGLEPGNYFCGGNWVENRRNYDNERRAIHRDLQDFRTIYSAIRWRESIDVKALEEATRAFSGRLKFVERDKGISVDYCTGQYFPTEFRRAACAVLASALWDARRSDMPSEGTLTAIKQSPGDWIREHFRREFGARIARRYFD